jgi:hypothetical protein
MKNGLLIQADVREIGIDIIKYIKAKDPNGPLYSIFRENVYAIMHDNGEKDYFDKPDGASFTKPVPKPEPEQKNENLVKRLGENSILFDRVTVSVGAGILETYSKVGEINSNGNKSQNLPNLHFRAFTSVYKNIDAGIQLSFGKYNYSELVQNNYDASVISNAIDENIFSAVLAGRYMLEAENFRPYGILGFGYNRVKVNSRINFVFEEANALAVESANIIYDFSLLARAGAKLDVLQDIALYGDIGTGINLLQFGVEWKIK